MRPNDLYEIKQTRQFRLWLQELQDNTARALILRRIDRARLGNLGDWKSLGDSVIELRFFFGPGYRVYLTYIGKTIILLLCGGDKRSQARDIDKAKLLASQKGKIDGSGIN